MIPKIDPKLNILSEIREPNAVNAADISKREVNSKLSQIVIGKELLGEVLGKRADGTYLVKVANLTFKIDLPNPAQLGERLHLTPLTVFPKTSFLLNESSDHPLTLLGQLELAEDGQIGVNSKALNLANGTNGAQEIKASKIAEFHAQAIANTSQELPEQSTTTHLSNASQLITHLLTEAATELPNNKAIQAPLLLAQAQPFTASELSSKLQQSLEKSGLFYESHVAQWSRGQLPLNQIQREAQLLGMDAPKPFPTQLQELPAGMAEILRQQLHFIEHQNLTWQGMLNPQTPMSWRINEQTQQQEHEQEASEAKPSTWLSHLQVDFPHLGKINIQLQLHENQLHASFKVMESEHLSSLRQGLPELTENLLSAQIQLVQTQVSEGE